MCFFCHVLVPLFLLKFITAHVTGQFRSQFALYLVGWRSLASHIILTFLRTLPYWCVKDLVKDYWVDLSTKGPSIGIFNPLVA